MLQSVTLIKYVCEHGHSYNNKKIRETSKSIAEKQ